ncbi:substrate-binding domain-containing protein [Streptomyces sp. NPDC001401]|uniref:substrate-binding domain-containing protein n=1 Tax=Streptomyces sp. NPDC001401 TaxID=3364570 RepID=UPI0036B7E7CF
MNCRTTSPSSAPPTGQDLLCCAARLDGYRSALQAAGLPADPDLVVHAKLTREDGCAAAHDLLSRPNRPAALFAANDLLALGVCQAAREAGLRIPEDLSVVGFDDLTAVSWVDPPLTTVHQPLTEMAIAATELALTLGRGEQAPRTGLEIASLTVRRAWRHRRTDGSTARNEQETNAQSVTLRSLQRSQQPSP